MQFSFDIETRLPSHRPSTFAEAFDATREPGCC